MPGGRQATSQIAGAEKFEYHKHLNVFMDLWKRYETTMHVTPINLKPMVAVGKFKSPKLKVKQRTYFH